MNFDSYGKEQATGYFSLKPVPTNCAMSRPVPSIAAVLGALLALWATGVQFSAYSRYALSMLAPLATAMSFVADGRPRARYLLPLLGALAMLPLCLAAGAGAVGARTFAVALAGGFSAYALVVFRRPRRMKVVNRIEGSKLIDWCRRQQQKEAK